MRTEKLDLISANKKPRIQSRASYPRLILTLVELLQNEPKKDVCQNSNGEAENKHQNTGGYLIPISLLLLGGQGLVVLEGVEGLLGERNGALAEPNAKTNEGRTKVNEKALNALCKTNAEACNLVPKINEEGGNDHTELNEAIANDTPNFFYHFHSIFSQKVLCTLLL